MKLGPICSGHPFEIAHAPRLRTADAGDPLEKLRRSPPPLRNIDETNAITWEMFSLRAALGLTRLTGKEAAPVTSPRVVERASNFVVIQGASEALYQQAVGARADWGAQFERDQGGRFREELTRYTGQKNDLAWARQMTPEAVRGRRDRGHAHPTAFSPVSVTRDEFWQQQLSVDYDDHERSITVRGDLSRLGPEALPAVLRALGLTA